MLDEIEKPPPGQEDGFSELSSFGGLNSSVFTPHLPEYQAQILARRDRARLLAAFFPSPSVSRSLVLRENGRPGYDQDSRTHGHLANLTPKEYDMTHERDAWDETGDAGNGILGQHLKCAKGKWLIGSNSK